MNVLHLHVTVLLDMFLSRGFKLGWIIFLPCAPLECFSPILYVLVQRLFEEPTFEWSPDLITDFFKPFELLVPCMPVQ